MKILIPTLLFFFAFRSASAMIVATGSTVVIDRPVFDDIYLAGGTVTVNAPVHGDIVAAGGTIFINDTVFDEVFVAGANVTINGYVAGKIRCLGGALRIIRPVNGDLVIAGGTISLEHNAIVSGSLLATGGNVILNGAVKRDIHAACASLRIYDTVSGNIDCRAADIEINAPIAGASTLVATRRLDIGLNAAFYRDVQYWAPETVDFGPALKDAKANRDTSLRPQTGHWYFLGGPTIWAAIWYLGAAFAEILLLQLLLGPWLRKAGAAVSSATWRALGTGFLWIFGIPILVVLLCFTAIGLPIAAVVLLGYISVWILSLGLISTIAANWLNTYSGYAWTFPRLVTAAFGCAILLRLLLFIPWLGWIAAGFICCLAFGAILANLKWKKNTRMAYPNVQHQVPA
ncbi:MAG TPA: polymer-forming cytoskeletal protein [Puia sp.]|nr:polymer-forming cytoskeletal protein [Puia sp.]